MTVDGDVEPAPIFDDDIYLKTCKRDDKREYKLPEDVLEANKKKIVSTS